MDAKSLVDKVEGLYSLPEVCRQLGRLLDEACSEADLAELIGYDSVLSAKLFGLANKDPRFYGQQVKTIPEAISRVGSDRIRSLMASTTATNVFANVSSDIVDMDDYWQHSVCCALACESLARQTDLEAPQLLFDAGLMHDIGQLVIYQVLPDLAVEVLCKAGELESYRYRMEQNIIGFTHAAVGQELLSRWQLPLLIQKAVEFHHEPQLAGEYTVAASILHIATAVANCVEPSWKKGGGEHSVVRQVDPFAWRTVGLSPEVIDATVSEISIESMNVLTAVDPESTMIF